MSLPRPNRPLLAVNFFKKVYSLPVEKSPKNVNTIFLFKKTKAKLSCFTDQQAKRWPLATNHHRNLHSNEATSTCKGRLIWLQYSYFWLSVSQYLQWFFSLEQVTVCWLMWCSSDISLKVFRPGGCFWGEFISLWFLCPVERVVYL